MFKKMFLVITFLVLYSVSFGEFQYIDFPNVAHDDTLTAILRERLSYEGNIYTYRNGLTADNSTNNAYTWTENSEDIIWTFGTNIITLSSSTSVTELDFGTLAPSFDTITLANGLTMDNAINNQLEINENSDELIYVFGSNSVAITSSDILTWDFGDIYQTLNEISAPSSNPASDEGWFYVKDNGGTTTPYFEDSAGTVTSMIAGAGTPAGSDTQMQYNNSGAFGAISTIIWDDTNLEFADDQGVAWGTDANWVGEYDESVDDQFLWSTAGVSAAATTDPMWEILVDTGNANGTGMTADQQVFGIAKGSQGTNVALFTVDEDGDGVFAGSLTLGSTFYQQAIASAASGNVNLTVDAAGTGTMTFGSNSTGKSVFTRAVELDGNTTIGDASSDTITVTGTIISNVTLDDGTTDSPSLTLQDATNETAVFVKLDNGDTTLTIPADTDFEIVAGNMAVGNGTPSIAMDGEDLYVNGDFEVDGDATLEGAVTFNGLPTGAAGLTITGAAVNLNASSNFAVNVATGTSTGTVTVGGNGIQTIAIGDGAAAKTVSLGSSNSTSTTTLLSGSGGLLLNASNNQPTNINTGNSTGTTTLGNALSDVSIPGHIQGASPLILDGATDNDFEATIAVTDPTADIIWTLPDGGAQTVGFMSTTLATNIPDVANSVWGGTSQLIFEGSDADTEEHVIQATDPTADIIWILADGPADSLAIIGSTLTTNNTEIANSIWGGTNQLIFEGSDADTEETVLTVVDPTADNTYTFSDDSGSVAYTPTGGTTKDNSNAALPVTHGYVAGTSGAASAWSLPDGKSGQLLTVSIVTDGGVATITPDTANSGWATVVLTDDGDTVTFLFQDGTTGWTIQGMIGIAGQPVITQ